MYTATKEVFLIATSAQIVFLFVYLRVLLHGFSTTVKENLSPSHKTPTNSRRRLRTNPLIICSFPMIQKGRSEAPLY